jgi:outer membrane protein assembly factor BamB
MMTKSLRTFAATLVALCALTLQPAWTADEVSYQLNPAHTGAINFSDGLKLPLQQIWSVDLSRGGSSPASISNLLVAEGKVFLIGRHQNSLVMRAMAFDLATGSQVWSAPVEAETPLIANATYADGKLFVLNFHGRLYALDPSTGQKLWGKTFDRYTYDLSFHFPPAAANGLVYLSGSPSSVTAQTQPWLFAVSASDGRIVWRQPVTIGAAPAIVGNRLLITDTCHVYRLNALTGQPVWGWRPPVDCSGRGSGTPVVYRDKLYAYDVHPLEFANIFIFPVDGGRVVKSRVRVEKPPVFYRDIVFYTGVEETLAFSLSTGKLLWRFDEASVPPPIVVNGRLLVAAMSGLQVLDSTSGEVLQTIPYGFGVTYFAPMAAGDGTIVLFQGSKLRAFKGADP